MAEPRWMYEQRVRSEAAKLKREALQERESMEDEISTKWKEGFNALKAENDRLQKEMKDWYKAQLNTIDENTKALLAGGPK